MSDENPVIPAGTDLRGKDAPLGRRTGDSSVLKSETLSNYAKGLSDRLDQLDLSEPPHDHSYLLRAQPTI